MCWWFPPPWGCSTGFMATPLTWHNEREGGHEILDTRERDKGTKLPPKWGLARTECHIRVVYTEWFGIMESDTREPLLRQNLAPSPHLFQNPIALCSFKSHVATWHSTIVHNFEGRRALNNSAMFQSAPWKQPYLKTSTSPSLLPDPLPTYTTLLTLHCSLYMHTGYMPSI